MNQKRTSQDNNRNTLTEWDLYTLTMRDEADAIAERFTTKELKHLIAELRRHVYARLQVRTRPLVEFETERGRLDRIGSGRKRN